MSKLYQDISHLVFRRNIPIKLERYVFNCEMLQVLTEMDGKKTVAAIAAGMNLQVEDLLTTFFTLYKKKLIFIVKSNPIVNPRPASKSNSLNAARVMDSRGGNTPLRPKKRPASIGKTTGSNSIEKDVPHRANHPREVNVGSKSTPPSQISTFSPTAPDGKTVPNKALKFKSTDSKTKTRKSGLDIFSTNISRPREFAIDEDANRSADNAIAHFEKGLDLLQRRKYEEALRQFELSLEINPQNRLCRANIQRIRNLMENGKASLRTLQ